MVDNISKIEEVERLLKDAGYSCYVTQSFFDYCSPIVYVDNSLKESFERDILGKTLKGKENSYSIMSSNKSNNFYIVNTL